MKKPKVDWVWVWEAFYETLRVERSRESEQMKLISKLVEKALDKKHKKRDDK